MYYYYLQKYNINSYNSQYPHIVESCPLTKLNGGLSRLHSADEDAVSWLTNYGKWHAYEKKKIHNIAIVLLSSSSSLHQVNNMSHLNARVNQHQKSQKH